MSWSATLSTGTSSQGFWARQFGAIETPRQKRFDAVFGVILPVAVLVLDPIVFQSSFHGEAGVLSDYQIFAYLLCGVEMGLLLVWRSFGRKITSVSAVIGGALIGGALFSFVIGLLLTPFSIIGLMFLIGVAGFTPYLTSFVYLRNGIRAIRAQDNSISVPVRSLAIAGALVSSLIAPQVLSLEYSRAVSSYVTELLYSEGAEAEAVANRLRWFPNVPLKERRRIVQAYVSEGHSDKKATLARCWRDLTREDIDYRIYVDRNYD